MKEIKTQQELEKQRIEDFYKVLTFYIVDKIQYYFKGDIEKFYKVTKIYNNFISCKNKKYKYDSKQIHKIYDAIIKFNQCGLNSNIVRHILGKDETGKYLNRSILEYDIRLIKVNNGSICMNQNIRNNNNMIIGKEHKRFHYTNKYLIKDIEYLKKIFADKDTLDKVRDAGSDFYTDRQRRLIFTLILKQKNYHYKTSKELVVDEAEMTEDEMNDLIEGLEI